MAEVSEGRVRGRPRLGWMDGVKLSLGNRGVTVDAVRQYTKDRKERRGAYVTESVSRAILLGPAFFRTAFPCSGGYHLERCGMPLHDGCGWDKHGKRGATTEIQGAGVKNIG